MLRLNLTFKLSQQKQYKMFDATCGLDDTVDGTAESSGQDFSPFQN